MRLLLDTHIYLWVLADDRKLTRVARDRIADADEVFVSAVSIWEATIKIAQGKLDADVESLVDQIEVCGFAELPVKVAHAAKMRNLPPIHHDPFDRLLIAQAVCEPLNLLTADGQLAEYSELVFVV